MWMTLCEVQMLTVSQLTFRLAAPGHADPATGHEVDLWLRHSIDNNVYDAPERSPLEPPSSGCTRLTLDYSSPHAGSGISLSRETRTASKRAPGKSGENGIHASKLLRLRNSLGR